MAIIRKDLNSRPLIPIENGSFSKLNGACSTLERFRSVIERAQKYVGRIETSDKSCPYLGTAFLVSKNVVLTTGYVAKAIGDIDEDNQYKLKRGMGAWVNFLADSPSAHDTKKLASVTEIVFVHPYWDIVALRIDLGELGESGEDLPYLELESSIVTANAQIVVIGFPSFDLRNDSAYQEILFKSKNYAGLKHIMPGHIVNCHGNITINKIVGIPCLNHDASTLNGCAGSPLIDLKSGNVIGVHHTGLQYKANVAIPSHELLRDRHNIASEPWLMKSFIHGANSEDKAISEDVILETEQIDKLVDLILDTVNEEIELVFIGVPIKILAAARLGDSLKASLYNKLWHLNKKDMLLEADGESYLHHVIKNASNFDHGRLELQKQYTSLLAIFTNKNSSHS
jgi:hypothetical protein